jgi:hypothetical protein
MPTVVDEVVTVFLLSATSKRTGHPGNSFGSADQMRSNLIAAGLIGIASLLGTVAFATPQLGSRVSSAPPPANEAECLAKKGAWTNGGGIFRQNAPPFCVLPASDAGKECRSSRDCASTSCRAKEGILSVEGKKTTGVCAAFNLGGCVTTVEKGTVQETVCSD